PAQAGKEALASTAQKATPASSWHHLFWEPARRDDARRPGETILDQISLTIADEPDAGEFIVLLGPSGGGKSTILNMIAGLLQPDAGEVRTFGRVVTGPNPDAVTVFQQYTCFPWLTVLGNVEYSLKLQRGLSGSARRQRAQDYLRRVGLEHKMSAFPTE